MFFIRTKNKIIETTAGAALSLNFVNPAFDTKDRAFSLPFLAAGEVTDGSVSEMCLDGLPAMKGSVQVLKSKRKLKECVFKNVTTRITDVLSTLKVNEILPEVNIWQGISTGAFQGVILAPSPTADYFSVSIKGQFFEKAYTIPQMSQVVTSEMAVLINTVFPNFATVIQETTYQLQFKNISDYDTFDIDWNLFSGFTVVAENYPADFQEQAIRQKLSVEQDDFALPLFQNAYLYDLKNGAFRGYINDNRNGTIPANDWYPTMLCDHTFCPQVRFEYILRKALDIAQTQTGENITLLTSAPHDQTITEVTLFNLVTIDNFVKENHFSSTDTYKNAYQRIVKLNDHVPDMTVQDLIEAVCEIFQLYVSFENEVWSFKSKRDQFETVATDLSNSIDNRVEKEFKTAQGFTLVFPKDEEEALTQYPDLEVGGTNRIEVRAGTVAFQRGDVPLIVSQKKGTVTQLGISSKTPLRLFYYKGFQTFSGVNYPFGTPLNQLPDQTIDGVASIRWEGAQGLYAKAWQNVVETATNAPTLKIPAWLTALQVITLKSWKMPQIQFYTEGGYRKGMIKSMQVRVRQNPQTRYECELEILEI